MLAVLNPDYLKRVMKFARDKNLMPALMRELWHLHTYACHDDEDIPAFDPNMPLDFAPALLPPSWSHYGRRTSCNLGWDGAPASFSISMHRKDGSYWFNGGLIYHGDQSGWVMSDGTVIPPGYGVETWSVAFGVDTKARPWSLHT